MITATQYKTVFLPAILGACTGPFVGFAMGALVPWCISTFGMVVAGVGTLHASLAGGGIAAFLQSSAAALLSVASAIKGGIIGAVVGAFVSYEPRAS